jgi:DNA-damage-inducible protein J
LEKKEKDVRNSIKLEIASVAPLCYSYFKKQRFEGGLKMSKTATVRARVEPELKKEAEDLLGKLGLSATQAIALFYRQIALRQGLPFDVVIPNETTLRTFEKTDAGKDLMVCKDSEDLFKKLSGKEDIGTGVA